MPTEKIVIDAPLDFRNSDKNFFDLSEAEKQKIDILGFGSRAEEIVNFIVASRSRFMTVGVLGDWGSGKTSMMRLIEAGLQQKKKKTVWFNAWRYDHEINPVVSLLMCIEKTLCLTKKEKKASPLSKIALSILCSTKYTIGHKDLFSVEIAPGEGLKTAKDLLKSQEKLHYYEIDEILNQWVQDSPLLFTPPVVVFLDDLDRCTPENALRLIDATKSIFDTPGFVFVIGIYPPTIIGWLKNRYKTVIGFDPDLYVHKIIQVPIYIQDTRQKYEKFIEEKIMFYNLNKSQDDINAILRNIPSPTPRLINQYFIAIQLQNNKSFEISDSISIIIKLIWPHFYNSLLIYKKTFFESIIEYIQIGDDKIKFENFKNNNDYSKIVIEVFNLNIGLLTYLKKTKAYFEYKETLYGN